MDVIRLDESIPPTNLTMSSKEIAELTGKGHGHVLRDIRNMQLALSDEPEWDNASEETDARGYTSIVHLPKSLTLTLVSGYNVVIRKRIIDRWLELEAGPHYQIPKNYASALRLAANLQEQIEQNGAALAVAAPAIAFREAVAELKDVRTIEYIAKTLGYGRNTFFRMLKQDKILIRNSNMPYQEYLNRGYFVVREGMPWTDSAGDKHSCFTTYVTGKGQIWLAKKYEHVEAGQVAA